MRWRGEVPLVGLVAAEDERQHTAWSMLAERESEPGSPRGPEEVRTLDVQRVENGDSVGNTRGQRVGAHITGLVAAP